MYQYPTYPMYQQRPYQNTIVGKRVNSFDEVALNDIPMDGSVAVFVNGDLSEVQTRSWRSDGTIAKTVFKPIVIPEANTLSNKDTEKGFGANLGLTDLYEKIDRIEEMLKEAYHEHESNGDCESNAESE